MAVRDIWDDDAVRLRILLAAMLTAICVLLAFLWRIQVTHGKHYQRDLVRQSIRRVRVPGQRGQITDRNSVSLAANRPSYCVAVYLEELRRPGKWARTVDNVEQLLQELSAVLELPRQITRADIETHIRKRAPLPLLAWRDLDDRALARFAEQSLTWPGVDVYVEPVRIYPEHMTACHVLGYVGRADLSREEETEPFHYYLPEMAGRAGIEKVFDGVLRGEAGGRLVRVDASGFRHDDLSGRAPRNGCDVRLSLDVRIQRLTEQALVGQTGAAVVVDPANGDVLALASTPGFDPNEFMPFIPERRWAELLADPGKPLLNKAVAGAFAPGSTFKPVVAMAALENGRCTPQTTFACPGYLMLGSARFGCWYAPGHGLLNLRQALQHSCNVYFYRLALAGGYEPIYHMAAALGLGVRTDISLDYEAPGILPDDAWKRRRGNEGWRDGDTCNLAIGQGFLTATPLQMAMVTAALANGGRLYRPRLVLGVRPSGASGYHTIPPHVVNDLGWNPANLKVVRDGMVDVVNSPNGTGKLAYIPTAVVAGKTGTAEYGRKGEGHKYGWMIAFAPADHPRYAIAMVMDEAVSGGATVAPRMKILLNGLFSAAAGKGAG